MRSAESIRRRIEMEERPEVRSESLNAIGFYLKPGDEI
jgi:hypothetical protein